MLGDSEHVQNSPRVFSVMAGETGNWAIRESAGRAGQRGQAVTAASTPQMSPPCSSEGTCFSQSGGSSR